MWPQLRSIGADAVLMGEVLIARAPERTNHAVASREMRHAGLNRSRSENLPDSAARQISPGRSDQYRPDCAGFIINFPREPSKLRTASRCRLCTHSCLQDIPAVGVTVNQPLGTVAALLEQGIIDIAQLHGQEDDACVQALQAAHRKTDLEGTSHSID